MFRLTAAAAAAAAAALLCLCGTGALAESTASNPTPPLSGDFLITPTPILTPWQNGASASEGSSSDIGRIRWFLFRRREEKKKKNSRSQPRPFNRRLNYAPYVRAVCLPRRPLA